MRRLNKNRVHTLTPLSLSNFLKLNSQIRKPLFFFRVFQTIYQSILPKIFVRIKTADPFVLSVVFQTSLSWYPPKTHYLVLELGYVSFSILVAQNLCLFNDFFLLLSLYHHRRITTITSNTSHHHLHHSPPSSPILIMFDGFHS